MSAVMPDTSQLPHLLAALNLATIVALVAGLVFIRRGDRGHHRAAMVTALALGISFLGFYVVYHLQAGLAKFGGTGIVRPIYFSILIVHILLSAMAAALVPITAGRALTGRGELHRRLARTTWSLWMLVATTGLVVYVMTVHLWPERGGGMTAFSTGVEACTGMRAACLR
jgi:uncharacterized membrane protein YozB (DUF420 family)